MTSFLELLLADAPVEAFEAAADESARAGAPARAGPDLREELLLALKLREVLQERRRRERELAALYETAGDLTAMRDVERVLQAIVRRARQLLAADVAYLTLIDEEAGDTCMRVTQGTVGEEFRRLRLPFGVGLGGLVAQNVRPSFTSDYLHDPRFVHTIEIDAAVRAESIVAIVGVPLTVGERVIGVLFAADRSERHFTPDEVSLLSSLGAHAAIAIENARLFQEVRQALGELDAASALVRAHSDAVERAAAVHQRLTDVVLEGGDLGEVAAALAEVLEGTLTVVDGTGRVVAGDPAAALDDLADGLARARALGRTVEVDGHAWITPVVAGAEPLGALVLAGRSQVAAADLRTLERAAQVAALVLLNRRSVAEAEHRLRGQFLEDLLSHADHDPDGLRRRAGLLGLDLDRDHALVVASGADRERALTAAAPAQRQRGGLVAERGQTVVLLLPQLTPAAAAALVAESLSVPGRAVTVGAAGPARTPAGLAGAYLDAERCRRVLLALGREGEAATVDDLGVYALLFSEAGRRELDLFVQRTVGAVLAYDAQRATALAATLEAYFAAGGNVTRAAAALHVHVNTLYQRLERLASLLGATWQEPDRALEIHLALKVQRLRHAL